MPRQYADHLRSRSNVSRIVRIIQRMDESGDEPSRCRAAQRQAADVVAHRHIRSTREAKRRRAGAALKSSPTTAQQHLADRREVAAPELKALIINMDTPWRPAGTRRSDTCAMRMPKDRR